MPSFMPIIHAFYACARTYPEYFRDVPHICVHVQTRKEIRQAERLASRAGYRWQGHEKPGKSLRIEAPAWLYFCASGVLFWDNEPGRHARATPPLSDLSTETLDLLRLAG